MACKRVGEAAREMAGDVAREMARDMAWDGAGHVALDTARCRSYDPAMPVWRCPHCGNPQTEAARCWVCRRSSTSCATCVNFRHAVFGGLGYCGLDRGRSPLQGDEIRPCWVAPTTLVAEAVSVGVSAEIDEHPFTDQGLEPGGLSAEQPAVFWIEVDA